jgi:hypothetical protein
LRLLFALYFWWMGHHPCFLLYRVFFYFEEYIYPFHNVFSSSSWTLRKYYWATKHSIPFMGYQPTPL